MKTLFILALASSIILGQNKVWEYKTCIIYSNESKLTEPSSMAYNGIRESVNIKIPQDSLNENGADGWELVTSYLELETVYPNFGEEKYVTGIQPNIRSKSLTLIFKRLKEKQVKR